MVHVCWGMAILSKPKPLDSVLKRYGNSTKPTKSTPKQTSLVNMELLKVSLGAVLIDRWDEPWSWSKAAVMLLWLQIARHWGSFLQSLGNCNFPLSHVRVVLLRWVIPLEGYFCDPNLRPECHWWMCIGFLAAKKKAVLQEKTIYTVRAIWM